jgi:hypothetical protein
MLMRFVFAVVLVLALVTVWQIGASPGHAETSKAIYDPNPSHLWNRLHEVLFIRTDRAGSKYGEASLDPLRFGFTRHLLESKSQGRVIAILE